VSNEQKTQGLGRRQFLPYPEYKDSGIESIGRIPKHWSVSSLGRLGRFSASGIDKKTVQGEEIVRMVNYTDVYSNISKTIDMSRQSMQTTCPARKAKEHSLRNGDILFTPSSETEAEIGFSAVVIENMPNTVYSYHLIRFRPSVHGELDIGFCKYLGNNSAVLTQFTAACKGTTRQILTREDFRSIIVVLPPINEQLIIAAFLDRETAKIDALIEKKERLIELLQEKRTALITQAVTKGFDSTVPMKDSGVNWLGEIPTHWSVHRLKLLASINDEALSEKTDPQFEMIYVDIGGVDKIQGILEREEYLFENAPSRARRIVRDGDVIISTVRTYLRAIAPIKSPESNLIVSTGFAVVRPISRLNSDYAAYALRATYFVENIVANSTGVSYPAIEASKVSSFSIAFPELSEQQRIVGILDEETAKIDILISKVREAITKLREYRTTLITAVVTGKANVQGGIPSLE